MANRRVISLSGTTNAPCIEAGYPVQAGWVDGNEGTQGQRVEIRAWWLQGQRRHLY
jgi:hypothetical protein